MEIISLLILLTVGFGLLYLFQLFGQRRRAQTEDKVLKGYFLLGLSGLMAKIAQADGHVTADESDMAVNFFKDMSLTEAERALCIGHFVTSGKDAKTARDHANRFLAYATPAACEYLYALLWRISMADGVLDVAEEKLLGDIALYLGVSEAFCAKLKAGAKPEFSAATLRAAGVPPSLFS